VILEIGLNKIRHDALVEVVHGVRNKSEQFGDAAVGRDALRRNFCVNPCCPAVICDSDKLFVFAREKFGHIFDAGRIGLQRISDWGSQQYRVSLRFGQAGHRSRRKVIARGYGVCRDFRPLHRLRCGRAFKHAGAITSTGHLPDIGSCRSRIARLDFHAFIAKCISAASGMSSTPSLQ